MASDEKAGSAHLRRRRWIWITASGALAVLFVVAVVFLRGPSIVSANRYEGVNRDVNRSLGQLPRGSDETGVLLVVTLSGYPFLADDFMQKKHEPISLAVGSKRYTPHQTDASNGILAGSATLRFVIPKESVEMVLHLGAGKSIAFTASKEILKELPKTR